jgi:hypothetical protein
LDTQDVHNAIGSMMDHFNETDHTECNNPNSYFHLFHIIVFLVLSNTIEENVNTPSEEMESDQQPAILSRSQMDEDIVEIEGLLKFFSFDSIKSPIANVFSNIK